MKTPTQSSFAELEYSSKKRQTRREKFLAEMEQVVPWALLLLQLDPHYPQSGRRGRQPMALNRMLRIHCNNSGSVTRTGRYPQGTSGRRTL